MPTLRNLWKPLSKEVNAVRVAGQATKDQVAALSSNIDALMKSVDASSAEHTRSVEQHNVGTVEVITGPRPFRRARARNNPHEVRDVAQQAPQRAREDDLRTDEAAHTDVMRQGALQSMPFFGTWFGIVFATRLQTMRTGHP